MSVPVATGIAVEPKSSLPGVQQSVFWIVAGSFQATSYPLAVCSAPIGAHVPNSPAVTTAPASFNFGPAPVLTPARLEFLTTSSQREDPNDSIPEVRGAVNPSPLESQWNGVAHC